MSFHEIAAVECNCAAASTQTYGHTATCSYRPQCQDTSCPNYGKAMQSGDMGWVCNGDLDN